MRHSQRIRITFAYRLSIRTSSHLLTWLLLKLKTQPQKSIFPTFHSSSDSHFLLWWVFLHQLWLLCRHLQNIKTSQLSIKKSSATLYQILQIFSKCLTSQRSVYRWCSPLLSYSLRQRTRKSILNQWTTDKINQFGSQGNTAYAWFRTAFSFCDLWIGKADLSIYSRFAISESDWYPWSNTSSLRSSGV